MSNYKGFPTFVKQNSAVIESRQRLTTESGSLSSITVLLSIVACQVKGMWTAKLPPASQ